MSRVELPLEIRSLRNPPEQEKIDQWPAEVFTFVLLNFPKQSPREWIETEKPYSFEIGNQAWTGVIEKDSIEESVWVLMKTINPKTGKSFERGISFDKSLEWITGAYQKIDKNRQAVLRIPPQNFNEALRDIRKAEYRPVLNSYRQTRSIIRTSELRGLNRKRVRAYIFPLQIRGRFPPLSRRTKQKAL